MISSNRGSAIYLNGYQFDNPGFIVNNTVIGNYGGVCSDEISVTACNNILAFNRYGIAGGPFFCESNCVFGNIQSDYPADVVHPTDINVDPLFRDMTSGDYRLRWDSPCIDAGTNEGAPSDDIEGSMRPMDGNHDGIAIADIGAYESPMPVHMDVLHDTIRLQPNKLIQVAILSDPVFNALSVDVETVVFGPGQAREIHGRGHPIDANGDGLTDLLFHFSCAESGIVPGYQTVSLSGKLLNGGNIVGSDGVMGIAK